MDLAMLDSVSNLAVDVVISADVAMLGLIVVATHDEAPVSGPSTTGNILSPSR